MPRETAAHTARKPTEADRFIGKQMRQGRRELGITQERLADALGLTFQQIQKYETGRTRLPAGRLRDVAILLRKPVDYFFEPMNENRDSSSQQRLRLHLLKKDAKSLIDGLGRIDDVEVAIHVLAALAPAKPYR